MRIFKQKESAILLQSKRGSFDKLVVTDENGNKCTLLVPITRRLCRYCEKLFDRDDFSDLPEGFYKKSLDYVYGPDVCSECGGKQHVL